MKHRQYFVSRHIWRSLLSDNFPQQQLSVVILSKARPNPSFAERKLTTTHLHPWRNPTATSTPTIPLPTEEPLVTIYHKPGEHQETLIVPQTDVSEHLAHGDYLGTCQDR